MIMITKDDDTAFLLERLKGLDWKLDSNDKKLYIGIEPDRLFIRQDGLFLYYDNDKLKCKFEKHPSKFINEWAVCFLEEEIIRYSNDRINQIMKNLEFKQTAIHKGPYR